LEGDVIELKGIVGRIKKDLYNGDDNPDNGLVSRLVKYLTIEEDRRKRRMSTSNKIALLAICATLCLPPVGFAAERAIEWINDVSAIVHEWHQINHSQQSPKKTLFDPPAPVLSSNRKPQTADGFPVTVQR
jgi:hypothetical protein